MKCEEIAKLRVELNEDEKNALLYASDIVEDILKYMEQRECNTVFLNDDAVDGPTRYSYKDLYGLDTLLFVLTEINGIGQTDIKG